MDKRPSQIVEEIRRGLTNLRATCDGLVRESNYTDELRYFSGLATCGIIALHHTSGEFRKTEIRIDDHKYGPHLDFNPRGIGTDSGTKCFACGAPLRSGSNIAAFTSQEHGKAIVAWFSARAGGAWLDFRPTEPTWVQVKVTVCGLHLKNLERLLALTGPYGVIREKDIDEAIVCKSDDSR